MTLDDYDYDLIAPYYDVLESYTGKELRNQNVFLEKILRRNDVKTVLDFACGTGAQSIFLSRRGFDVTAVDKSKGLLDVAKNKAGAFPITFSHGDMRSSQHGSFDAIIFMYNAIGHVTHDELILTLKNCHAQLEKNGLVIFDIFNLSFFAQFEGIDTSVDTFHADDGTTIVRETTNELDSKRNCIHVHHTNRLQYADGSEKKVSDAWDMQLYSFNQLYAALDEASLQLIDVFGSQDGEPFVKTRSSSIMIVARKK